MFGIGSLYIRLAVWVVIAACIVSVFGAVYYKGFEAGKEKVQTLWNTETVERQRKELEAQVATRIAEEKLRKAEIERREAHEKEILGIKSRYNSVINSLRHRRARENSVPAAAKDTEDGKACTGAGLYRQDGEFLAGEAARADELRTQLETCYIKYNSIYQQLNEGN